MLVTLRRSREMAGVPPCTARGAIRRGALPARKRKVRDARGQRRRQWVLDLDDLLAWKTACPAAGWWRKPLEPGTTAEALAHERGIKVHSARRALQRARKRELEAK